MNTEIKTPAASPLAALMGEVDSLKNQRTALLTKKEKLAARLRQVVTAPLRADEVIALCLGQVDARARAFPEMAGLPQYVRNLAEPTGNRPSVVDPIKGTEWPYMGSHGGPVNLFDHLYLQNARAGTAVDRLIGSHPAQFLSMPKDPEKAAEFFGAFTCFFFGDVVKERLESYLLNELPGAMSRANSVTDPKVLQMSTAQRKAEAEQVQEQIEQCDAELKAVDEQIVAIPLDTEDRKMAARRLGVDLFKR
jgi:hypothetical protein